MTVTPSFSSLVNNVSWQILSKALLTSRKMEDDVSPVSMASIMYSTRLVIAVLVEQPDWSHAVLLGLN